MRMRVLAIAAITTFGTLFAASAQTPRLHAVPRPPATAAQPTPTPADLPVVVQKRSLRRPGGAVRLLPTPTPTPEPFPGIPCKVDRDCDTGACYDGVCCDQKCDGNCRSCALPGHAGICTAVPDGLDPRRACQVAIGGTPACGGACYSGQCASPDVGTWCGLCAACDGNGRCTATPADDERCGVIVCSGLDTRCRIYQDLRYNRCAALGTCKSANDAATCTIWINLPCS